MLTATARSCVDTLLHLTDGDFRVGELLRILDQQVGSVGEEFHMTCFASIYDPVEETLTYANAGHNQPFLLRYTPNGWRTGRLKSRGNRLGDANGHSFVEHTVETQPRDLLCWYSDGLIEALSAGARPFGSRRLRDVLKENAGSNIEDILDSTLESLSAHIDSEVLADDVTCVIGRLSA
jgi:sigma-B regulation protein RsbU (phosphoserine phosphatase)